MRIDPDQGTNAYIVVHRPMSRWQRLVRWLRRKPTADVFPVRVNPPVPDGEAEPVTFTVPWSTEGRRT